MDMTILYRRFLKSRTVSTDSRNITPGCIFFALKGENFNGNLFAGEALEKGALAAIVDEPLPFTDSRIMRVGNVLEALQHLASHHRKQVGLPVLAITGSNGKTTTKELCKAVLSRKFRVHATEGNLNNHIGVPLTILSIKADCELAIIEMGANHHGEINALCEIALPDYGLVTNVGKAHLEGFGDIEGVARAKSELFRHLIRNSKTIFLNGGSMLLVQQVPEPYPDVVHYNTQGSLTAADISGDPCLSLTVNDAGTKTTIRTNLAGSYNAENVLAAYAVGLHFGIGRDEIKAAISDYEPRNNRSQIIKTARNTVFMDAYNANPSSMAAAIEEFLKTDAEKKMLILGEMREVGDTAAGEHAEIIATLKENGIKNVICVGKSFEESSSDAGYRHVHTVDQLNKLISDNPPDGHFIMVKGSRSNHLEKVLPLL